MTNFIDPEELPFTRDEVFRAACRFQAEDGARLVADTLSECGPGIIESRAKRRASWREGGMPNADAMWLHAWCYPEELLPALASLSADAESRALAHMEVEWREWHAGDVAEQQREAAEAEGIVPSRAELMQRAQEEVNAVKPRRRAGGIHVFRGPSLPPPTSEMFALADARVAAKRREWMAAVEKFRSVVAGPQGSASGA